MEAVVGALYDGIGGVRICTTATGNSRQIFLRDLISKFKA